ncbi:alpha/beta hydrolase [Arthrobacter agilis]|uniref:alpha/beta fold hydrolase n=1 Tax=Arthrobacter agilis TaxID=37921 RepID=UPI002366B4AF|nr:alpha/beta hydrolase [Arthrobacter agilis]WDF33121.1 alpha/beta hydrolase [Arthrobacter agilis]
MELNTVSSGTGARRIALIHGIGADASTWRPFVERLTATGRYTVTAVDLRGHGASGRAGSYHLDDFAQDIVETLPTGLDSITGHSLGGSVLARAVSDLRPARAIYLDPGFRLALPTSGIRGRLFWMVPPLSLGVVGALQARRGARSRASYTPEIRGSLARARAAFDGGMAAGVFRDVAFNPVGTAPPAVPSTIVLSDDSPAVVPKTLVADLGKLGWEMRRLSGVGHDMHLEDPQRTLAVLADRI